MSDKSKIEWTDATWNPIRARNILTGQVGWHCEHISGGCKNCYAGQRNKGFFQLGTRLPYAPASRDQVEIFIDEDTLTQPLRWKRPRKIFVCSMTDLFGEFHSDEMIDRIFAVMGACDDAGRGHVFQVLTKRAERMLDYMKTRARAAWNSPRMNRSAFPPRNIWLGVSCEDQKTADERIPHLLETPAAVRFLSCEPLLGPVEFSDVSRRSDSVQQLGKKAMSGIDWVIVGGESGPHARPMHPDWALSLQRQCAAASVPYFFKQWGEFCHWDQFSTCDASASKWTEPEWFSDKTPGVWINDQGKPSPDNNDALYLYRVGKKNAGRRLCGREYSEFPEVANAR